MYFLGFDCSECVIQEPPLKWTLQVVSAPATCLELDHTHISVYLTVPVSNLHYRGVTVTTRRFYFFLKLTSVECSEWSEFLWSFYSPTDCKGPRGEPKFVSIFSRVKKVQSRLYRDVDSEIYSLNLPSQPGEVWQSNCNLCTCNNQTGTEECFSKPPEPVPLCGPSEVLVTTSCCGDQLCGKNIFSQF